MACNSRSSCGPDFEQLRLWLKGIILELLNDGTLQAGLKDCEGEWLGKGRGVVLCDALADLLCDLINEGKLCVPKIAGFTSDCDAKTLTITMADGTELTADASCFGGSGADGNTKIRAFTYDPQTSIAKITDTENREFEVTISTKNTTNREMTWEPNKQEVSVTDTDNHTVKTPVVFNTIAAPPVNRSAAPSQFIGKSSTVFLGEPAAWLRMLLPDGRIGKMPVFLDDTVAPPVTVCDPWKLTDNETGDTKPLYVTANAVRTNDTWATWYARNIDNNAFTSKWLEYLPNSVTPQDWKDLGQHIYDWVKTNEDDQIDNHMDEYLVDLGGIGFVSLRDLLVITDREAYPVRRGYTAYENNAIEPYWIGGQGSMGLSTDGNIYVNPQAGTCGFTSEPPNAVAIPFEVSISYLVNEGGRTREVKSDPVAYDRFFVDVNLAVGIWPGIIDAAEKARQGAGVARWTADGNGKIVSIITSLGTIDVQNVFDFAAVNGNVDNMKQPASLKQGVEKIHLYRQGQIDNQYAPGGELIGIDVSGADKNNLEFRVQGSEIRTQFDMSKLPVGQTRIPNIFYP